MPSVTSSDSSGFLPVDRYRWIWISLSSKTTSSGILKVRLMRGLLASCSSSWMAVLLDVRSKSPVREATGPALRVDIKIDLLGECLIRATRGRCGIELDQRTPGSRRVPHGDCLGNWREEMEGGELLFDLVD